MGELSSYLFLLRVPILCWLGALLLPVIALRRGTGRALLRGAFDLSPLGAFQVMVSANLASLVIAFTAGLICEAAPMRFGLTAPDGWWGQAAFRWHEWPVKNLWLVITVLSIIPSVVTGMVILKTSRSRPVLLPVVLATGSVALTILLWPAEDWATSWGVGLLARVVSISPEGYLTGEPGLGELAKAHTSAAWLFVMYLFLYSPYWLTAIVYAARRRKLPSWLVPWGTLPALHAVFHTLIVLCLCLAALTFFLDRFRIPLLLMIVAWNLLWRRWSSGHTFGYYTLPDNWPWVGPRDLLELRAADFKGKVIIVCASGGGIHAAAWTARVLTGLEQANPNRFAPRVRLISSVSGGSIGAMHYLAFYDREQGGIPEKYLDLPNTFSRTSSLDAALGGWVIFDLLRLFVPLLPSYMDRGWTLERRWDQFDILGAPLANWGLAAKFGRLPAVLFNATVVETGQAIAFGTVAVAAPEGEHLTKSFHELYGSRIDVAIRTAARLSATFPLVSPAARLHPHAKVGPAYHFVDGGYYDNYGVSAALDFLDSAVPAAGVEEVLIVEIRAAPTTDGNAAGDHPLRPARPPWFGQILAPLQAIVAVRSTAQRVRNETELRIAAEAFSQRGVAVKNVRFVYPEKNIPLSWHLTEREKEEIDARWSTGFAAEKRVVADFCREPVSPPPPLPQPSGRGDPK